MRAPFLWPMEALLPAHVALFKWAALSKALVFLRKFFARFISNRIVYRVTGSWVWVAAFVVVVLVLSFYLQSGQPAG